MMCLFLTHHHSAVTFGQVSIHTVLISNTVLWSNQIIIMFTVGSGDDVEARESKHRYLFLMTDDDDRSKSTQT